MLDILLAHVLRMPGLWMKTTPPAATLLGERLSPFDFC